MENKSITHINAQSFRTIYDLYYGQLCKFLNFYTHDETIIEDVVQEVFIKLWESRDELEIEYIKTYLFRMARNKLLNQVRNEEHRISLLENWVEDQLKHADDTDCFDIDSFYQMAQQAIENLPPKCKELFLLNRESKLTYRQISEQKEISIKTVETQIGIALKKIRESLYSRTFIIGLITSIISVFIS